VAAHPAGVITVVGGGVIGYTSAVRLAQAGHDVTVVTADDPASTTSAVAAAIWFPYLAAPLERVLAWGSVSLGVFAQLADDPATGVYLRQGVVIHRTSTPDLGWTQALSSHDWTAHRPARPDELPPGARAGTVCTVPVVDTGRYLLWLRDQAHRHGVRTERAEVAMLDQLPRADVTVLAAGLRSGALAGDGSSYPVRGQVVRVANPGLTRWLLDDDDVTALTYIVPRGDDVVCGGTLEPGQTDTTIDPATEAAILDRAIALEPKLAGAPILSRAVGLRPARPTVRLDRSVINGRPVVSCYGHGGAGVTLSWGCADEVTRLVEESVGAATTAAPWRPKSARS
jgi:D-amino-acid oxidase